jgi:hypothetical protein
MPLLLSECDICILICNWRAAVRLPPVKYTVTVFLQWTGKKGSCQEMWTLCEDLLQPEGSVHFTPTATGPKSYCVIWPAVPHPHLAVAWEPQGGAAWRGWHPCPPSGCWDIHPISQQVGCSLLFWKRHLNSDVLFPQSALTDEKVMPCCPSDCVFCLLLLNRL